VDFGKVIHIGNRSASTLSVVLLHIFIAKTIRSAVNVVQSIMH